MDRAFIFDVFGTLVDWREGVATIVGSAFEEHGVILDAYTFADAWRARYGPY
jgi:2-haloacid dehalogenase